jgi:chemotaxis protein methyltransferase CheR
VSSPRSFELSATVFEIFARLIEEECGVHYAPQDRSILESKLETHAFDLNYDSLLDYYYHLRYDDPGGADLRKLVEAALVHETYFFRELPALTQLVDGHLAAVIRERGRARIWSAACSTGEEPFTLAMLLAERGLLDQVEIVASDISDASIGRAKRGRHKRRALRDGHPAALAARYLEDVEDGLAVVPTIRDAVSFVTVNLLDDAAIRRIGRFDAVVCRNVLIYFRDERIARVVDRLAGALVPDGLLAVGVSESLLRFGTALVCEERGSAFFYRAAR